MTLNGTKGVYFAVWAPHAVSVSLVGDFNNWDPESHPMTLLEPPESMKSSYLV